MTNKEDGGRKWNGVDKALASIIFSGVTMMGLSAIVLTSARAVADSPQSTQASVTVTSSCELAQHVDTAHEAEVIASMYRDNIGKTTFTATCNDANGYDVYAVGYTNTEFGRNDMLGQTTGRTIETGTAQSGDTSNWAMKLTSVAGQVAPTITTGYTDYHEVPDDYTKVATYVGSTMAEPVGSQFESTYAAYVSSTQAPDTYLGKVRYTLVHPSDASAAPCTGTYTIAYNSNGGSGSMESQTACVDRQIAIQPSGFSPASDEWQFGAWNTEPDGSGYTYYGGQRVANLAAAGGTATLYAIWAPHYIQDLTRQTCSIVANERKLTVVDKRDGNDYDVRYLEGACWMTQNLRIMDEISPQYSNFHTYSVVDVCEGGDLTNGNTYDVPRCMDSGNVLNGVWYNYAAASAKTILTSSNTNEATEDICPAGWHLPNYDTTKPAGSVNSLAGISSVGVTAFQPVTGGYYRGGSISNSGYGYWWSSTASDSGSRYNLGYGGSSLSTSSNNRNYGMYIRCVR